MYPKEIQYLMNPYSANSFNDNPFQTQKDKDILTELHKINERLDVILKM